jgi:glutamate racemase
MKPLSNNSCIGIFDSGVGGLSVLREIRDLMPGEQVAYVADQAHVPYGSKPLDQVRVFSGG